MFMSKIMSWLNAIIRINTRKEGYDVDYEVSRIQTFISKFRTRRQNKELKL